MRRHHLYGLDLVRVLASLAVMAFHYCFRGEAAGDLPAMEIPYVVKFAASYGYLGVHVFFIVSGFVIAYSAENSRPLPFLATRLARIYPTFLILMSITALVTLRSGNPRFVVDGGQYLANLFIVSPLLGKPFVDGVYWSLVLELVFYGWVFLILCVGHFDKIISISIVWILLSFANEYAIQSKILQNLFITQFSGFFAVGIAIHCLSRSLTYSGCVLFAIASAHALSTTFEAEQRYEAAYGTMLSKCVIACCLSVSVILIILLVKFRPVGRSWHLASLLGGATYAQYLIHQNVGYIAITALMSQLPASMAVVLVSVFVVAFSIAFHLLIERRLTPAVRRLMYRLPHIYGRRL